MNDDLVARLRALADRTWSDPIGAGLTRHGHVLDDDDRALLHEAADEIERLSDDVAGWMASYDAANNALIALLEADR